MNKIIFVFTLLPTMAWSAQPNPISLELEYFRDGRHVCGGTKTVQSGEELTFCESHAGEKKIVVRTKVTNKAKQQVLVSSVVEEIDQDGMVKVIGSPQILALLGEESAMAQISDGEESGYKLIVKASSAR